MSGGSGKAVHICTASSEPLLLAGVKSTEILCAGPNIYFSVRIKKMSFRMASYFFK